MSVLLLTLSINPMLFGEELESSRQDSRPPIWSILQDQWTEGNRSALAPPLLVTQDLPGVPDEPAPVGLTLREAIELALKGNVDIKMERYTTRIALAEIGKAEGIFDLVLSSTLSHGLSQTPTSSQLQGRTKVLLDIENTSVEVGLNKLIKTGGLVELKFDLDRLESNSTFLTLNPSYTTNLNLVLSQPLLKNAGVSFQSAPIRIAQNLHLMSEDRWRAFVSDTLVAVVQAYWDLVFSFQNLEVRKTSLDLAREMLRRNEKEVNLGKLAPIDLLQAKTGVALRKEELINAENLLQAAQDLLKELLQLERAPTHSPVQILPKDAPPDPGPEERITLEESIAQALKNRPEYRAALKDLENKNLQIKLAGNQLLPSLDVTGTVGLNGLGGSAVEYIDFIALQNMSPLEQFLVALNIRPEPTATSPMDGGLDKSMSELLSKDSYQWTLGLRFEMPLQNTQGKARYLQAKMEAHKARWAVRSTEQKIILEVKEAWRSLKTNRERIRSSLQAEGFAQEQLEAEQKALALGLSTNYQLLKMEEDLRNAQVKTLRARAEFWKAEVRLDKAVGILLEEQEIDG